MNRSAKTAKATQHVHAMSVLRRFGMTPFLVKYIQDGTLEQKIADAYKRYDALVQAIDAWEAANAEQASKQPWFQARQAWKNAGRPRPEWYELLALIDSIPHQRHALLRAMDLEEFEWRRAIEMNRMRRTGKRPYRIGVTQKWYDPNAPQDMKRFRDKYVK